MIRKIGSTYGEAYFLVDAISGPPFRGFRGAIIASKSLFSTL
jgi:hypothetical protein